MGAMTPERVVGHETDSTTLEDLDFDFEIGCEIPARTQATSGSGFPPCPGRTAEWVAWRPNCCSASPRYLLVCDPCKKIYQNWIARAACIICPNCGTETGGFHSFTPLNRKS